MQFNDTTNLTGMIQACEFELNMPDTSISGNTSLLKHFTRLINVWLHRVITIILLAQDDWSWTDTSNNKYPIGIRNLVANQQDYLFSTAAWALLGQEGGANASNAAITPLRIQRVEITYDGTSWKRANPLQMNQNSDALDSTSIRNDYTIANPFYELRSGAIWVYPVPTQAVTGGLKVYFDQAATEFTSSDTTKLPPFDINFHEILPIGASFDYANIKNLPQKAGLQERINERMAEFKLQYGKKDQDIQMNLTPLYNDTYGS